MINFLPILSLRVVGGERVPELLLDQVPLDGVLPGEDGALGTVGVVEHPEHHLEIKS